MGTICSSSDLKRFTTCSPVAAHSDSLWLHFISVLRLFLPPLQAVISSAFYMYIYIYFTFNQLLFAFCSPHLLHWLFTSKN